MTDPNKNHLNGPQEGSPMDMLLSFLGIKSSQQRKSPEKKPFPTTPKASDAAAPKDPIYKVGTRRFKPSPLGND